MGFCPLQASKPQLCLARSDERSLMETCDEPRWIWPTDVTEWLLVGIDKREACRNEFVCLVWLSNWLLLGNLRSSSGFQNDGFKTVFFLTWFEVMSFLFFLYLPSWRQELNGWSCCFLKPNIRCSIGIQSIAKILKRTSPLVATSWQIKGSKLFLGY